LLLDGQRQGIFRADLDAPAVVDGIISLLSGFLYHASFDPDWARPERLAATLDALVRDVVIAEPWPESGRGGIDG
jgi:hypothetical protein